jgi:hypothetical protein
VVFLQNLNHTLGGQVVQLFLFKGYGYSNITKVCVAR